MSKEIRGLLDEAAHKSRNRYLQLYDRAREDPGTAGDQGEEIWAEILREWLPPNFQVVTKARLMNANGEASPQIDSREFLHEVEVDLEDQVTTYLVW